jgi:Asp-tRNA(Asn)/Glu-tRNA(Gln) amidotransferase A subunit family amidase
MNLAEYSALDAVALAALVRRGEVTPRELAETEIRAAEAAHDPLNAVVEAFGQRAATVDDDAVPNGPLRGDGGGSIRIPTAACGVVGLKPSRRRVSFGSDAGEPLSGWPVRFVVTRTVRDTTLMLDVLSGAAPGDPFRILAPRGAYRDEAVADSGALRIAVCVAPWASRPVDREVADAAARTARTVERLGHHLSEDAPVVDWQPFLRMMTDMLSANTAHGIAAAARALASRVGPDTLERAQRPDCDQPAVTPVPRRAADRDTTGRTVRRGGDAGAGRGAPRAGPTVASSSVADPHLAPLLAGSVAGGAAKRRDSV